MKQLLLLLLTILPITLIADQPKKECIQEKFNKHYGGAYFSVEIDITQDRYTQDRSLSITDLANQIKDRITTNEVKGQFNDERNNPDISKFSATCNNEVSGHNQNTTITAVEDQITFIDQGSKFIDKTLTFKSNANKIAQLQKQQEYQNNRLKQLETTHNQNLASYRQQKKILERTLPQKRYQILSFQIVTEQPSERSTIEKMAEQCMKEGVEGLRETTHQDSVDGSSVNTHTQSQYSGIIKPSGFRINGTSSGKSYIAMALFEYIDNNQSNRVNSQQLAEINCNTYIQNLTNPQISITDIDNPESFRQKDMLSGLSGYYQTYQNYLATLMAKKESMNESYQTAMDSKMKKIVIVDNKIKTITTTFEASKKRADRSLKNINKTIEQDKNHNKVLQKKTIPTLLEDIKKKYKVIKKPKKYQYIIEQSYLQDQIDQNIRTKLEQEHANNGMEQAVSGNQNIDNGEYAQNNQQDSKGYHLIPHKVEVFVGATDPNNNNVGSMVFIVHNRSITDNRAIGSVFDNIVEANNAHKESIKNGYGERPQTDDNNRDETPQPNDNNRDGEAPPPNDNDGDEAPPPNDNNRDEAPPCEITQEGSDYRIYNCSISDIPDGYRLPTFDELNSRFSVYSLDDILDGKTVPMAWQGNHGFAVYDSSTEWTSVADKSPDESDNITILIRIRR